MSNLSSLCGRWIVSIRGRNRYLPADTGTHRQPISGLCAIMFCAAFQLSAQAQQQQQPSFREPSENAP